MVKVIYGLDDEAAREAKSVVLTIGVFDGLHLGHRRVIETAVGEARRRGGTAALLTFDPHPRKVLHPLGAPPLLTSLEHRLKLMDGMGLDLCIVLRFDRGIADQSAREFVRTLLLASLHIAAVCVGPRFSFGRGREGGAALLKELGSSHGFSVVPVPGVEIDGARVSSTAIRAMVRRGELGRASRLLGRPYSIYGTVVRGKALGRKLGVPTANLRVEGELLPPPGVYTARVHIGEALREGVLNIDQAGNVEAYLFDFRSDIYGKKIEAIVGTFIREERAFPSLDEMARQIRCDIEIARGMLHNEPARIDRERGGTRR